MLKILLTFLAFCLMAYGLYSSIAVFIAASKQQKLTFIKVFAIICSCVFSAGIGVFLLSLF